MIFNRLQDFPFKLLFASSYAKDEFKFKWCSFIMTSFEFPFSFFFNLIESMYVYGLGPCSNGPGPWTLFTEGVHGPGYFCTSPQ